MTDDMGNNLGFVASVDDDNNVVIGKGDGEVRLSPGEVGQLFGVLAKLFSILFQKDD